MKKTWSRACLLVPRCKGLRIARSVGTSNVESPTPMSLWSAPLTHQALQYLCPHSGAGGAWPMLTVSANRHPEGVLPLLCL